MHSALGADRLVPTISCNLVHSCKDFPVVDVLTHLQRACGDVTVQLFFWCL